MNERKLIVITGPSAAGKTTIATYLVNTIPTLQRSISVTTRQIRGNEVNGIDYHFIDTATFNLHIQQNDFLEWEMVYANQYGSIKSDLAKISVEFVLVLNVKGAIEVLKQYPTALTIFIEPLSLEILEQRLLGRKDENEENLKIRLDKALNELSFKDKFSKVIVNHELTQACKEAVDIVTTYLTS